MPFGDSVPLSVNDQAPLPQASDWIREKALSFVPKGTGKPAHPIRLLMSSFSAFGRMQLRRIGVPQ
jgi:hypothetical protein